MKKEICPKCSQSEIAQLLVTLPNGRNMWFVRCGVDRCDFGCSEDLWNNTEHKESLADKGLEEGISFANAANQPNQEQSHVEKDNAETNYLCPNCRRDSFLVVFQGKDGFMPGIVVIECKCGLRTSFDWRKCV